MTSGLNTTNILQLSSHHLSEWVKSELKTLPPLWPQCTASFLLFSMLKTADDAKVAWTIGYTRYKHAEKDTDSSVTYCKTKSL